MPLKSPLQVLLNNTGLQNKDQPLFAFLNSLVTAITTVNNNITNVTTSGSVGPKGDKGDPGIPGFILGGDSSGGDDGVIAIPGASGAAGATGAQGPVGPPIFLIGDEYAEADTTFSSGSIGSQGPPGVAGPWTLLSTVNLTGANSFDVTGLGTTYDEFMLFFLQVTFSVSVDANIRYSTDNGATFNSTSGNYRQVTGAGAKTDVTLLHVWGANASTARDAFFHIHCLREAVPKYCHANFFGADSTHFQYINDTTTGINALRFLQSGAANYNSGTLYVLGR